jgi:imidazolonepropionase-like amidohydrolase
MPSCLFSRLCVAALAGMPWMASAQEAAMPAAVLFENVRIFNGTDKLSVPSNVLVVGNRIARVSSAPIAAADTSRSTTVIAGNGRTLTPGLIDAHVHIMYSTLPQAALLTADVTFVAVTAAKAAEAMLLRGFTSGRDVGGPTFGLKRAIDMGLTPGPRIWPSGAHLSQTAGHGDFRLPTELPSRPGDQSFAERANATAIADGAGEVLKRTREQLALGASQIKVMAGGGVSSLYDPLDVSQYTLEEMRAAVQAAAAWNTYVTVHAYTPAAVRQAVAAGVKCVEHGQLLDEPTIKLLADNGVWLSLQPFLDDEDANTYTDSRSTAKRNEMVKGTETAYEWAKKHRAKVAFGTDTLYNPRTAARQGAMLAKLTRWFTPAQVLKMATADNAELLALSGPRNPYPGKLGVVEEGALADLLLWNGDPLSDIQLIGNPEQNLVVVMKDGRVFKNTLK